VQYLGGKSRLAKEIAAIVAPKGLWWEPFCGGLSVSVQLAKYGPGIVSDINPALIALYQAVRDGWVPPTSVSREEWTAAKSLPDSDPMKAFCGFGCSFGGKWFGGYARIGVVTKGNGQSWLRNAATQTRKTLARDVAALGMCTLRRGSFFDVEPGSLGIEALYCDPPYVGSTGYGEAFAHARFWRLCERWSECGVRVYVSEYVSPVEASIALERRTTTCVNQAEHAPRERLFRVLPGQAPHALASVAP
jgi:DNA adenine methylase